MNYGEPWEAKGSTVVSQHPDLIALQTAHDQALGLQLGDDPYSSVEGYGGALMGESILYPDRVAACVNVLRGIPTDVLVRDTAKITRALREMLQ